MLSESFANIGYFRSRQLSTEKGGRAQMIKKGERTKEQIPKEVLVGRVEPGVRLAQCVVKMKDTVGALASVTSLMATLRVDIRQSVTYSVQGKGFAIYNAFFAFKEAKVTLEQLVDRLKLSPFVLAVQAVEGHEGTVVDLVSFPVNWQGRRVVIFSQRAISRMFESMRLTLFGSGVPLALSRLGADYGRELAINISKTVGADYLIRNQEFTLNLLKATGWGVPEVIRSPKDSANTIVRLSTCFECGGRTSGQNICNFVGGFLSGFTSVLANRELLCEETACSARGHPCCEFELSDADSPRAGASATPTSAVSDDLAVR
jgi:predicted hydrocarbon binding protein